MTDKELNKLAIKLKQSMCDHSSGKVYGFKTTCIHCGKILQGRFGVR